MAAEDNLVSDLFEGMCLTYLKEGEIRVLRLLCGLDTPDGPRSLEQIASLYRRNVVDMRKALARVLLKLPERNLDSLQRYLEDEQHAFHRSLTSPQRKAMLKIVTFALVVQQTLAKAPAVPVPRKASPPAALRPQRDPGVGARLVSRTQALASALDDLGRPSHYEGIHKRALQQHEITLTPQAAYQTIVNDRDFLSLGDGMFALARWHNRTEGDGEPRLRYCPPLPISAKARADTFFELVIVAHGWMTQSPITYQEGWLRAQRHLHVELNPQDLVDLWYAVGLCASVDFARSRGHRLVVSPLPVSDVAAARGLCLETSIQRIDLMPAVLRALADLYHPTAAMLAEMLYGDVRDSSEFLRRLRLLEALGGVRSTGKNEWTLTSAGFDLVEKYAPEAMDTFSATQISATDADARWDDVGLFDL